MELKYLFTGTPKSGTQYISRLMTSVGYPVSHEMIFGMPGNGVYEDNIVGESSWLVGSQLHRIDLAETTVIHITREPLKVISSLKKASNLENYMLHSNLYCIYKLLSLPELKDYEGLDRYLYFYLRWNKNIEHYAHHRLKLEDITEDPFILFNALGLENVDTSNIWTDTKVNSNYGKAKPKYYTLEDIKDCKLFNSFNSIRKKYNY